MKTHKRIKTNKRAVPVKDELKLIKEKLKCLKNTPEYIKKMLNELDYRFDVIEGEQKIVNNEPKTVKEELKAIKGELKKIREKQREIFSELISIQEMYHMNGYSLKDIKDNTITTEIIGPLMYENASRKEKVNY